MGDTAPAAVADHTQTTEDAEMNSPVPPPPHSDFHTVHKTEDSPGGLEARLRDSDDSSSDAGEELNIRNRGGRADDRRVGAFHGSMNDRRGAGRNTSARNHNDRDSGDRGVGMHDRANLDDGGNDRTLRNRPDRPSRSGILSGSGPPPPVQMKVRKKPGPPKTHQTPIKKDDVDAKKGLIWEIERHWGSNFIKKFIPKIHRPLIKRKKGQGKSMRKPQDNPLHWMPSILKAILEVAKKCDDVKKLKDLMGDVVRYRNAHTGNKKPQLVTTDFDMIEDILDRGWSVPQAFSVRYKHLINNKLETSITNPEEEYSHLFRSDNDESDGDDSQSNSDEEMQDADQGISNDFQLQSGYMEDPPPARSYTMSARGFVNSKPIRSGQGNLKKSTHQSDPRQQSIVQSDMGGYGSPAIGSRYPDSRFDNGYGQSHRRGQQINGYGEPTLRDQQMGNYEQLSHNDMRGQPMNGYGYGQPPMYGQQGNYGYGHPFPRDQFLRPGGLAYRDVQGFPGTSAYAEPNHHPRQSMNDDRSNDPRSNSRISNPEAAGRRSIKRQRPSRDSSPETPLSQLRVDGRASAMQPPLSPAPKIKTEPKGHSSPMGQHGRAVPHGRTFEVVNSLGPCMNDMGVTGNTDRMRDMSQMGIVGGPGGDEGDAEEAELQAQLNLIEIEKQRAQIQLQLAKTKKKRARVSGATQDNPMALE